MEIQTFYGVELERIGLREGEISYRTIATEQFHSDENLEATDRRALDNSKIWQCTMEGDVNERQSILTPLGGK